MPVPSHSEKCLLSLVLAALLLGFSGSSKVEASDSNCVFPGSSRYSPVGDAREEANWDIAKLEQSLVYVQSQRSSAVVVVLDGELIAECYWKLDAKAGSMYSNLLWHVSDTGEPTEDVASLQKSVVSLLVGIAIDRGMINIDAPVSTYLDAGWSRASQQQEALITIKHLLSMTSGLSAALEYQAPAGSVWLYNTRAYSLLVDVLEKMTGKGIGNLTRIWLTEPMGMSGTAWKTRPWVKAGMDANSIGLYSTARDLVRLGQLMLSKGNWEGKRLVSESYIEKAVTPSQSLNPSYGLLWWLNGQPLVTVQGVNGTGMLVPQAPVDMYAALGALGRKVFVAPSTGLIVVRLGDAPEDGFNQKFWELLVPAIQAP